MRQIAATVSGYCLFTIILLSCSNNNSSEKTTTKDDSTHTELPVITSNTDTFYYRFEDASIPPQFHRSYTIIVAPEKIYLSIDSYGSILTMDTLSIDTARYISFYKTILSLHLENRTDSNEDGCTGGTTDIIALHFNTLKEFKGNVYHCGNKDYGTLTGDVGPAVNLFKSMIPDLAKRIDATRKN